MSCWLTIPSARPASEIKERLERWRDMGYKIALWRNGPHVDDNLPTFVTRMYTNEEYPGWGSSINRMTRILAVHNSEADWFVGGGDDTDPDPTKRAEDIARECSEYFVESSFRQASKGCDPAMLPAHLRLDMGKVRMALDMRLPMPAATFGVMQPTGDRWGADEPWAKAMFPDAPAYIDRICGSPWIGREFARRMNQGKGPFWPEYFHMHADEELQCVAQRMGVLWQRPDLTHFHDHPRRDGISRTPDFAQEIYSAPHWEASKKLFESRKAADFPGSEPTA